MTLSRLDLERSAASTGFQVEPLEKVFRLLELLQLVRLLNGAGEIHPEILTTDEAMQSIIRTHPALKWNALNVQKLKA